MEQEIARYRRQLAAMSTRAGDLQQQLQDATASLQMAEENHRNTAKRLVEMERGLTEVMTALDHLRGENEQRRVTYVQQMRLAAALGNEISALESQLSAASAARQRCHDRIADLDRTLGSLQQELDELRRCRVRAMQQAEEQAQCLAAAKDQLAQHQTRYAAGQDELSELRRRHSAAAERTTMLEELVRRHEGISAGVKEVLGRAADPADLVFCGVCGLVADLFHVSVEAAPLVEIALGQAAQHVVASRSAELLKHLETQSGRLGGRVGFLWLDGHQDAGSDVGYRRPPWRARPGRPVRGNTSTISPLGPAIAGPNVVCRDAGPRHAIGSFHRPRRDFRDPLRRAVGTRRNAGGGAASASSGLISRRSQLRALQTQLGQSQTAIDAAQTALAKLGGRSPHNSSRSTGERRNISRQPTRWPKTVWPLPPPGNGAAQFDQQRTELEAERQTADAEHDAALHHLAEVQDKRQQLDRGLSEMEASLAGLGQQIDRLEGRRVAATRETTEIKVELAKCEERLRNLQARMRQFEESRQERHRAIDEARQHLAECQQRGDASRRSVLQAEAEIAELYLRKEAFAVQTVQLIDQREALQVERTTLAGKVQEIHGRVRKLEEKIHAVDLSANEVRHERNSLAERMREDYGIVLSELEHVPSGDEQRQREEVQQEIEELRHKINNLGNVNLEALDELEQLESRHKLLADQYQDLSTGKASLEKIIDRINTDSRRLFSETLDTVKGHFQTLFRNLFGGGHADIVLEENVDLLDSGIEIVARPPGKEPRSISLLSGGEKTMTCVALLLAIFRSRPSPFCVLDEVDAALDEANIDRFIQVLQGFLAWTQFIIVTHSKKTMTCANTIYGVTMQESGVSKQVSVRFEDVSDDGHILSERPPAEEETQAA